METPPQFKYKLVSEIFRFNTAKKIKLVHCIWSCDVQSIMKLCNVMYNGVGIFSLSCVYIETNE